MKVRRFLAALFVGIVALFELCLTGRADFAVKLAARK